MDGNTVSTTCRTFRAKLLSVLLAVLMLFTSIPAMFPASASGSGGSGNPIVLTNASVEFRDKYFKEITDTDSGEIFYLMAKIGGNNVEEGEVDFYRIEISDKNLLLPNFAGNGFKDGAVYNGYTLHVNSDGSRYITFQIDNGETKQIRLQAKFQNGKTANGTAVEVKLTQESSGKSVSNQITADAAMQWSASKGENRTSLKAQEIAKGTTVNYTLSASPNNASKKTGAEWVQSLKFEDTISLENMTFLGDAKAAIQNAVKAAIQTAGYDAEPTVTVNDGKADISFVLNSRNENAEMPAVNLNVALPLNSSTVKMNGTADGKVTNSLTVSGKPYGDNASYSTIGGNSVELKVSAPQGPKFSIGKTVQNGKAYYVNGDTVEFEISASNTGDAAGNITLKDNVPDGMTLESITAADGTVSGNSVTFQNVAAGATVTAKVVCKVSKDQTANLTNEVTDGNNTAKATISVKEDKAVIETPVKSGYVTYNGKNLGQKYYPHIAGQTATYTISVTNSGAKDAKGVLVSDDSLSYNLENMTYTVDGVTRSAFPDKIDVPAGKTVQITVTGTIRDDVAGEISNVATVDGKPSNKVKFTPDTPKAQLGITKTADVGNYTFGTAKDVVYTITVTNNGEADAENVKIEDILPDGMTFRENSGAYGILTLSDGTTKNITSVDTKTLTAGGTITVPKGESITLTVYANVEDSATAAALTNTAKVYEGAEVKGTATHTIYGGEDLSKYSLQKKIIAVNGIPADDTTEIVNGDKLTYQATFTNNGTTTMENLYLYDYGTTLKWETSDVLKVVAINGNASDSRIQTVTVEQDNRAHGGYAAETFNIMGIKLAAGESVTVEYVVLGNDVTNNNDYNHEKNGIQGFGGTYDLNNSALMQTLSAFETKFGTQKGVYNYTAVGGLTVNEHGNKTVTWYAHDMILNPVSNTVFEAKKSLTNSADKTTNIVDMTAADLEQKTFSYSLALSGSNNDYAGKTIVVEDTLPDGMEYVPDSVEGTANYTALSGIQATRVGQTLTFTFVSTEKFANQWGGGVKLTYQAKLTADKAQELANSTAKKVTLTNTLSKVTVVEGKNDGSDRVISPEDKVDISFTKTTPAPGFAKLAVASYAGKDYQNADLQKVENGYITAGDTLIWQAVLYNGKGETTSGKATLNGEELGKLDLTDVTLTDNLPSCYEFDNTSYPTKYFVVPLKADGSFAVDKYGMVTGNDGAAIKTTANGDSVSWDVSSVTGTGVTEGKLEPNYAIVVQFATTVKDGQEKEGVITNTGYAEVKQPFTAENTVAGEKRDTQIWNYANYNIVGLTTESWKTITYTNNGHNGDPHTDPATDTGYSREPTHNYVQGMQGEDVTYELHIKNNSPVDLENMTIIDRLPYVGDLGLVSGYARNSAFGVKLKSIDSVMVGGTDVIDKTARSYSTDKTSVLNEYSKDWLGQNDVMNWTNIKSDDTVNFRIQLQDTTVKVGDEVVVKVTATVPSYVAKTGEENIAWNSFAYSYQNPDILGDTVMVAEPAKVGVWVQTPDTTVDVTVNKTLTEAETKDATFYFALFTDENYTTRLSDVISVTIPAGQTAASVTMKDVDLSSIKQQTNNANNVYLLETDAKGNQIRNYTPTYTGNAISTDATTKQTVGVTNTKNTGEIKLTKTLAGVEGGDVTGDTFYFALFTKNAAGDYVRYEEVPVQSLTFTEADSKKVTFENVPKGMDFYVLETNSNGVPTYTGDSGTYTADSGIRYSFVPVIRSAVQAGGTTTITNFEETQYSITVSKVLNADNVKSTPVFSVGLFTKSGDTYTQVGDTQEVIAGSEVKFSTELNEQNKRYDLKADTPYYIFEMDGDKRVENGASFQMPVVLDPKNSTTKTDTTFYVSYDCCDKYGKVAALTLTKDAPQASTIITNSTDNPTKITVTKIATEDGNQAVDHAIEVGLFTQDADGNYQEVSGQKKTITIAAGDKGKKSVTFDGLDSSKTYYVFELDAEGNRVENGGTTEVSNKTFVASYSGGNMVAMDVGIPGAKTITDTHDGKIYIKKFDVNNNVMEKCEFTLTGPNNYKKNWSSSKDAEEFSNLKAGTYTLTETEMNNFVQLSMSFTIDETGCIVTQNPDGSKIESTSYALSANTVTLINRAKVSVDKQNIANSDELAGATIKITRTNGGLNEKVLEVKRGDTALTKETSLDESDYSKYTQTSNTITFISDGKAKTDIIGLPDGDYTMEEVAAPDGYNKVKTTFTFTIDKGQVTRTSADSEEYDVSGNDIVMKDSAKKTISIGKQAVGGGDELTGAELQLTVPKGVDLSQIEAAYGDQSTNGIVKSDKTISWKSDGTKGSVELTDLPAGTYTLKEITAPDGFTKKTEEMNFEVGADGKVGTVNGLTKDDNKVVMEDAASKLTIGKKDITGKQEVTGAKLTLTLTKPDESGATLDGVTVENIKNNTVDSRTADSITWTSGKTDAILSKLPDGEYTLKETGDAFTDEETGKTYTVIESTMTFTVENGVVTKTTGTADSLNDKAADGYYYYDKTAGQILVCDAEAVNVVPISKQDAGSGAEVAGATLEITAENVLDTTKLELSRTDKNGNKTVLVKDRDYSISTDGKTIQFVSGEDVTIITGLPAGSYQLKETNAPDGYQLYTAEETFTIGTDGKVTGTTTIQDKVSKLTIAKKDITGKQEVTGATLTLKLTKPDESGATLDGVTVENIKNITVDSRTEDSITWTSGKTDAILSKLPDGKYTLKETGGAFTDTETGKTYTVIESTMTFTVENGVVTSTTGDADNLNDKATEGYYYYDKTAGQILVCDAEAVNVVPISKQDAGSGAEVAGATLEITAENVLDTTKLELSRTDKNGNKTVLVKDRDYSISTDGKTIQFVSGEDVTIITGLPAGSYQLKETNAPDGYQLYTAEETFTIGTDGKVTGTTTIQDKVSKLTIAKKDITGKQEVTGAKLTLTLTNPDESGATLDGVKANITVDSRDAKSITWTSGKTDAILSKLPDGKYTLKETGGAFTDTETGKTYTVIESTMTFTVENGVITKSNAADNLNDKATEGYYYYDKTKEEILVCDAEQPAITTTSTSETTTTSTTTTPTRTSATTESSTETTVSTTSATPTDTTTSTTASTAGPTQPTTTSTTGSSTVTTVSTTASTAGPTQPTTTSTTGSGTVTTVSTTESTATSTDTTVITTGSGTVTTVFTTASTAGPTQPTTTSTTGSGTVTTVSTTASTAGPTQPTTTSATATNTTTTTSSTGTGSDTGTTTTTQSATTVTATNTGSVTETTPIVTVTETAPVTTTTCSTIQTTETTPTTVTTVTTPVTTVTTTELERGVLIRKCDMGGNEIAGASLQVADLDGNVIDAWISEAGISHAIETVEVGVPYCLTELQAPVDYALAESIYFRLEEDGTVTILTFAVNEDGTIATDENGPIILTETPSADAVVTMFDEFIGIVTTTDITTETTTTTETETTTTTPHNTTNDNGNHTPSASETTSSGETTTETTNGSGTTTTDGSGTTTTTRYRSSSGSSSSSSSGRGSSSVRVSSTPKTDDRIWMLLFPTGLALTGAILTGRKRKKKHQK
ncbi:SpaA isopeptide-forming pilin-related protein [uncultured Ruminococcus sp.]|uniref:SpaA isopeptide-forming pilin-related protein n=1 Tax=uncultured Ruminococcus sp. TaxID=165186 RepID=UPI0025EE8718|nr:SpaA isopeptide-forming pilin-related protein [uncultured Ruminococcus sp.]